MNSLTLETFISPDSDWEINQYKILGGIKEFRSELNRKKIYPGLADIIKLGAQLEDIINQKSSLNGSFPKQIKGYNLKKKEIEFESKENLRQDVECIFELINWAMPLIKETVEEAIVLYEFVENNLKIAEVGLLPLYKNEGYFIIFNTSETEWQIHKFECSLFSAKEEKFRGIKTRYLQSIEGSVIDPTPESIKQELIKLYRELPNPATYFCETEVDFPFIETVFPIAKRKLMAKLAA